MSCVLSKEDYQILEAADTKSDGAVARVLNENGCADFTICPECGVEDFIHIEECLLNIENCTEVRTLQELTDEFNKQYLKACVSSVPEDWMYSALTGRHLVNSLIEREEVQDNLPNLQKLREQ
jgi:hypothetical protein